MTREPHPPGRPARPAGLFHIRRGEILGDLPRGVAERGYHLYTERRITRIVWTGDGLESELAQPPCTVTISDSAGPFSATRCTACEPAEGPCPHAVATLLQWLDVRPTMQRLGPGAAWRANSRHPFIAPGRASAERLDLSHLTGHDLRSALELQLSLQKTGAATARISGHEVEIHIILPSGGRRVVVFNATLLPSALPLLRSLPGIKLAGDLTSLELSEARLHPVLIAAWTEAGITVEPGYRLGSGKVLRGSSLEGHIFGRWARIGNHLCRVLDPATPLVAFHRRGLQVLNGQEALRFLNLDHPQLLQHPWYIPLGELATFRQPVAPRPVAIEAELTPNGRVRIRPSFNAAGQRIEWPEAYELLDRGFTRIGEAIVRSPDLALFEEVGFRIPKRVQAKGLVGTRTALIRLVAETGLPITGGDDGLQALADLLHGRSTPECPDPPGLRSHLRPYQRAGVAWLWNRYLAGIGALLADDMGLGKTHQVMGLLCLVHEVQRSEGLLVVCPRGVLEHWHTLLQRYAPDLEVHIYHGPGRSLAAIEGGVVVLTTYDILFRSADELQERIWEVAVFDEAQRIKNSRTKAARAARRIPAAFRIALSGTPLENRLTELWSVVDLILPGYLGSERDFRATHRNPTHHQLHRLRQRLSVLTLRRVKDQVLADLPEKVEDIRFCRMVGVQRELYEKIRELGSQEIADRLRDPTTELPYIHIFALLTRLKQVCDHPVLVDESLSSGAHSGKIEVLDQILDEALEGNYSAVVFSQYVTMIDYLSQHLDRRRIPHLALTGSTRDRGRIVRRFNSEQHERVLLASLLAGGVGIDLTGASVVIHYDRWWNPAKENQATDRVHRIGQRRFVQVFKLVTRDTVEERIDELIRSKIELMERVVAPTEDVLHAFDRRELAALLGIKVDG
jgi:superfamily II DNA or RNA helicase